MMSEGCTLNGLVYMNEKAWTDEFKLELATRVLKKLKANVLRDGAPATYEVTMA